MGLHSRAGHLLLGAAAAVVGATNASCYSAGNGSGPPQNTFYFPTGLAVSQEGGDADPASKLVLYAVNSDFDLQFSGGTLQSYDLTLLRHDAALLIQANLSGATTAPAIRSQFMPNWQPDCTNGAQPSGGILLGQLCAPPVNPQPYQIAHVTIAAFATDLQFSIDPALPHRLFAPVRGVAAVTWADVGLRFPGSIDCGQNPNAADARCDSLHDTGNDPNQPGNTRNVTMPGEPFGLAQTPDGTALAVTAQTDTKTSLLLSSGGSQSGCPADTGCPIMEFVLGGMPTGGVGIAAVPHDPDSPIPPCELVATMPQLASVPCVRPAFLETNHSATVGGPSAPEIDLLRYYNDDGSSLLRPFLTRENAFPVTSNALGSDLRGIVIDPTPRLACKAQGGTPSACAQLPARVFFSSRTPPALGIGEVGGLPPAEAGSYDPDRLVLTGNVPLLPGPSKVYLAPIVNRLGALELRVFVVLFDSNQIAVYDPVSQLVDYIDVGPGPFGMAFDPFTLEDVALGKSPGPPDDLGNRPYRYAYVASFTQSFVQMIDLDNSQPTAETFERVVYTLGQPTVPKGQ